MKSRSERAALFLGSLREEGILIELVNEDTFILKPEDLVTSKVASRARRYKPEIMELLRKSGPEAIARFLKIVSGTETMDACPDFAVVRSPILGEDVVWTKKLRTVLPLEVETRGLVRYSVGELLILLEATRETIKEIHAWKKSYGGMILQFIQEKGVNA